MVELASVCLETDVCVDALRGRIALSGLAARLLPGAMTWISSITLAELEFGASHAASPALARERLALLLDVAAVRPFDQRAAAAYGQVRSRLQRAGLGIGAMDTLIGAHALAEGAILVTRNVGEYRRIEGLTVVDAAASS